MGRKKKVPGTSSRRYNSLSFGLSLGFVVSVPGSHCGRFTPSGSGAVPFSFSFIPVFDDDSLGDRLSAGETLSTTSRVGDFRFCSCGFRGGGDDISVKSSASIPAAVAEDTEAEVPRAELLFWMRGDLRRPVCAVSDDFELEDA
jgi:hypothetical protein